MPRELTVGSTWTARITVWGEFLNLRGFKKFKRGK